MRRPPRARTEPVVEGRPAITIPDDVRGAIAEEIAALIVAAMDAANEEEAAPRACQRRGLGHQEEPHDGRSRS